jgi:hypothetical protein
MAGIIWRDAIGVNPSVKRIPVANYKKNPKRRGWVPKRNRRAAFGPCEARPDSCRTQWTSFGGIPANPFALAIQPPPSPGLSVTGIFGTQVVAVGAATGAVIAGTLGGWSCNPASPPAIFDGSFIISRLPLGRSYHIYVEPWDGLEPASSVQTPISDLCSGTAAGCASPALNTNFTTRVLPATPAP